MKYIVVTAAFASVPGARHLGRDLKAFGRSIVGGEISEYTKLLAEAREQALDRMVDEARELGASAIVGTRFATSMVLSGGAELLAFGTAVVIEPDSAQDA